MFSHYMQFRCQRGIFLSQERFSFFRREGRYLLQDGSHQFCDLFRLRAEIRVDAQEFGDHRSLVRKVAILHRILQSIAIQNIVEISCRINASWR